MCLKTGENRRSAWCDSTHDGGLRSEACTDTWCASDSSLQTRTPPSALRSIADQDGKFDVFFLQPIKQTIDSLARIRMGITGNVDKSSEKCER